MATGEGVGRIVGTAIQQLLEHHQGEYERIIQQYLADGTVAALPGTRHEGATCDIWGIVSQEQAKWLNLLALALRIPRTSLAPLVEQAINEMLMAHHEEHAQLLTQLEAQLVQQRNWGDGGQQHECP